MTTYRAFGNDATKQALRAEIRTRGPVYAAWLTTASIEGDLTPISRDYGLHPALARLLPALGAFGEGEEAPAFYDALLDAIPVGAETGNIARRAVLLAWTDPVYGRAQRVTGGAVLEACEAVIGLVRQSLTVSVDKQTWRAARAKLAQVKREASAPEKVDLVLSLAWDLEQAPGAVQDAMVAWTTQLTAEAEAADEDQFTAAEAALFKATMDRINEEIIATVSDDSDAEFSYEAFLEEVNKRWAADPAGQPLKVRALARQARVKAKLAIWRSVIQQKVLEDGRALAV
ncbi:hypothetical protein [Pelomonas cellulosilytica]|uniref:Uncharacterized protein n=1 Tax=Pelomonas cellulosilytica TaxID=2906762 RepID=A0ABS8Y165_9BURK|nr:hypothetical protein [Pelomonas sp. P8]MCE4556656.1 hypothetical protein [Pelomonas sp. P8]